MKEEKALKLPKKGKDEAIKVIKKHNILCEFFKNILGINENIADENACKIEHVIDDEVIERIKKFSEFCKQEDIDNKFKEKI